MRSRLQPYLIMPKSSETAVLRCCNPELDWQLTTNPSHPLGAQMDGFGGHIVCAPVAPNRLLSNHIPDAACWGSLIRSHAKLESRYIFALLQ